MPKLCSVVLGDGGDGLAWASTALPAKIRKDILSKTEELCLMKYWLRLEPFPHQLRTSAQLVRTVDNN